MKASGARGKKKSATHTVCYIDAHWDAIRAGAERAGKSVSSWWVECALAGEPSAKAARVRPLVLDAERQWGVSTAVAELARGLDTGGEASARAQADIRALLEEPLQTMARQGRRERAMELLRAVFDEERAETIAAAFMPDAPAEDAPPPGPPKESEKANDDSAPARGPSGQRELF